MERGNQPGTAGGEPSVVDDDTAAATVCPHCGIAGDVRVGEPCPICGQKPEDAADSEKGPGSSACPTCGMEGGATDGSCNICGEPWEGPKPMSATITKDGVSTRFTRNDDGTVTAERLGADGQPTKTWKITPPPPSVPPK